MTLSSLIEDVTGNERTLTVYDPADSEAVEAVKRHFQVQNVSVEEATAPAGPDWEPPEPDWLEVHAAETPEISESWFVVHDAPDESDCALVAEEREPNAYCGFWSYDEGIVADVLSHLRAEYGAV